MIWKLLSSKLWPLPSWMTRSRPSRTCVGFTCLCVTLATYGALHICCKFPAISIRHRDLTDPWRPDVQAREEDFASPGALLLAHREPRTVRACQSDDPKTTRERVPGVDFKDHTGAGTQCNPELVSVNQLLCQDCCPVFYAGRESLVTESALLRTRRECILPLCVEKG